MAFKPTLISAIHYKIEILNSYIDTLNKYNKNGIYNLPIKYFKDIITGLGYESKYPVEFAEGSKQICKYLDPLPVTAGADDIMELFRMYYNVWHNVRNNINVYMDTIKCIKDMRKDKPPPKPKNGIVCFECNKVDNEIFHVPNAVWEDVTGDKDGTLSLCMSCFMKKAEDENIILFWQCDERQYPQQEPIITPKDCESCYVKDGCRKGTKYNKRTCRNRLKSCMRHYPQYIPYVNDQVKKS